MSIDFSPERWEKIRRDYTAWWAGDLKRPLVHIELPNAAHPRRPEPMLPSKSFHGHYDLSVSAEDIVDRMDMICPVLNFLVTAIHPSGRNFGPGFRRLFFRRNPGEGFGYHLVSPPTALQYHRYSL